MNREQPASSARITDGVVRLDQPTIEAIAHRVAELVGGNQDVGAGLLTARDVAARFGVSRAWVYEHLEELGAIRLGAGKRPRLRFNARVVLERLESQDAEPASTPAPPTQWVDEGDLIPIRGLKRFDRKERP